jgi:two-component system cell cycle sensor histidine kinase/response regulator CckA
MSPETLKNETQEASVLGPSESDAARGMLRLTASVGHDFNHVLNIIRGYTELLLADLRQNDAACERLLQINRAVDNGASLARQLLAYGRNSVVEQIPVNVNNLIEELRDSLRRLIADRVKLHVVLGSDVGPVMVYPGQLQQVITNLVVNACDAMPRGGRLMIKTAQCHLDESSFSQSTERPTHRYTSIEVSDTGCGIEPAVQSRMFEPFFTTKEATGGTGLGLASVREILVRNGGEIRVETVLGHGSTFRVLLPCVIGKCA